MAKRKICVVTGTRAEFGPLCPLMREIQGDAGLILQVIVTGMHLSAEFGLTSNVVEKEFIVDKKIEMLLSSDTSVGSCKSMGLAMISFADAFDELNPDIVLVLGDRVEIFSAVTCAMVMNFPVAHISGGELTLGAIDDSIRHSITKMSHIHFVATEEYRKRVIQLGENPEHVYDFGDVGLDNIIIDRLLSRREFEKSIHWALRPRNLLVTYHPTTLDHVDCIKSDFTNILNALHELKGYGLIFTKANSDVGGRLINAMTDEFVDEHKDNAVCFVSLGQIRYLSALQYIDAVVGNSSSGLVEAPSFKIGTIDIGSRQKGRIKAGSVLSCEPDTREMLSAIEMLYTRKFQNSLKKVVNPYGQGGASSQVKDVLKHINLDGLIKKSFMDLECCH